MPGMDRKSKLLQFKKKSQSAASREKPPSARYNETTMRDVKMAELKVEAPLAKTEDWSDFSDFQTSEDLENSNKDCLTQPSPPDVLTNDNSFVDNFSETFSNSLEDLVNTFDDKITKCFCDYDENVEKLAPVQIRTQEEIMSECQTWWTITGNFGNILPIDWSKSYARRLQLPTLNLNEQVKSDGLKDLGDSDDEELAKDLDLHSLILSSLQQEPIFTAEQVLEEIDEIMQENSTPDGVLSDVSPDKSPDDTKARNEIASLVYSEKLKTLSTVELNEVYVELERMIRDHSETLIQELALRDELEFEKELKNTFISLLLSVQNKRRHFGIDRKKGRSPMANGVEPKYLTTVIPYHMDQGPPNNSSLQVLIKILHAINDDSPTVPTLLTDYILKVLCPT
ncbi:fasciculation and elongation protein zeta-2-like isoform X1 [Ornithodoros turicata]